ncbi:MAG: aminoglycoside 6-adenylyltransferase [Ruminiclostridium sp.]|nr:aminoglycoside 6-adenylyltransferase [Ruminiclostridium sp.]
MKSPYSVIREIAENDENIIAVVLYGSRANPSIKDQYQDYDILYIVSDVNQFDVSVFKAVKLIFIPSEHYPELFPAEKAF